MNKRLKDLYKTTGDIMLTNQDTLRKAIGFSGILLPLLLWIFVLVSSKIVHGESFWQVLPSISHYYYSRAAGVLVIVVGLIGVFLLIYKGEEPKDFIASSLAGLFALVLLLFPTYNLTGIESGRFDSAAVTVLHKSPFRETLHNVSAGIFLAALAYLSYFIFTKSKYPEKERTPEKRIRNRIYRVCALAMVGAMAVIFISFVDKHGRIISQEFYDRYSLTFWMETIAVEAFGISWTVKGRSFFTDKV